MVREIRTPGNEDSVKSVIGRRFWFGYSMFPKILETREARGDTTCAFKGIVGNV